MKGGALCAMMDLLTVMDLILMLQEWYAGNWDFLKQMVSYIDSCNDVNCQLNDDLKNYFCQGW